MSCKLISIKPIGEKYEGKPEKGDEFFEHCREYINCTCPNGRTYELGCHGVKGYKITRWLQDTEFCYDCVSENGCAFQYCTEKTVKLENTKEDFPCNAKDSNDCRCPKNPDLEIADPNPCG
jgi:hypothetical protein